MVTETINEKKMILFSISMSESDKQKKVEKLNKKGYDTHVLSSLSKILIDGRSPKKGFKTCYSIYFA